MITDEEIEVALLQNVSGTWRKMARVIGTTMLQIEPARRTGCDDLYFATRIGVLSEKGLIEHKGDLGNIRECEIRLSG